VLVKTRAILFKTLKYSENSVIAKLYTEEAGLESFIINNIRSKKAAINAAHLRPLSLLDADVYQRSNANLQRIKEMRCYPVLQSLYTDISKSTTVLFLQEVLNKVVIENEKNNNLFSFLFTEILWMDEALRLPGFYPSWLLLQLSRHLGFFPDEQSYGPGYVFLPRLGVFSSSTSEEPMYFDPETAKYIYELCSTGRHNFSNVSIAAHQRRVLLDKLLLFYRLHIDGFNELKSHKILAEVLA
jgi:DNA repair protein RecO (recombination protein O)